MGWSDWLIVLAMLAFGIPLARIDRREHRLPNALTAGLFASEFFIIIVATNSTAVWNRFGTALLGSLAMTALYFALALIPGGMGFGDVKLACSIGLVTAWWSWSVWILAVVAAFTLGAVVAMWVAVRSRSLSTYFPFGPVMLLGWGIAAIAALA